MLSSPSNFYRFFSAIISSGDCFDASNLIGARSSAYGYRNFSFQYSGSRLSSKCRFLGLDPSWYSVPISSSLSSPVCTSDAFSLLVFTYFFFCSLSFSLRSSISCWNFLSVSAVDMVGCRPLCDAGSPLNFRIFSSTSVSDSLSSSFHLNSCAASASLINLSWRFFNSRIASLLFS